MLLKIKCRRGIELQKPKAMKDTKIEYDGKEYNNIISLNRSYNYSSFSYLDTNGSEVNVYLESGKTFNIVNNK
jgi:hypothetical protein